jgi:hypothetical protein
VRFDEDEIDELAAAIAARLPHPGAAPTAGDHPEYVTRAAAKRLFGVEIKVLLRAERSGKLSAFKPGKSVVYRRQDVVALIERSRVAPSPANDAQAVEGDTFERAIGNAQRRRIR